jgi:hypothetical protein
LYIFYNKRLLDLKVKLSKKDAEGNTPVDTARENGHLEMIKILCADLNPELLAVFFITLNL